jgi:hypothetical protein
MMRASDFWFMTVTFPPLPKFVPKAIDIVSGLPDDPLETILGRLENKPFDAGGCLNTYFAEISVANSELEVATARNRKYLIERKEVPLIFEDLNIYESIQYTCFALRNKFNS